jgi:hypothetical protein
MRICCGKKLCEKRVALCVFIKFKGGKVRRRRISLCGGYFMYSIYYYTILVAYFIILIHYTILFIFVLKCPTYLEFQSI